MWLRRAVRVPWNVLGAVTALSLVAVLLPVKVLGFAVYKPRSRGRRKSRPMPEVYDAQQVAVMLRMVQAAMQYKSQELDKERSSSLQLRKEVDDLQESLENTNWLFAQEQQHRLGLQAELEAAETAAADLRQMLSLFFGDSPASSPGTASDAGRHTHFPLDHETSWRLAAATSPSRLHSGLPGTLDRRDSRLQMDLAGIQKRLHKIAQLRDTPPSSPRSSERISAWSSPSRSDAASPNADLSRSRTLGSRVSPLKLSPLRTTTIAPSVPPEASSSKICARLADPETASLTSSSARVEAADSRQQSPEHSLVSDPASALSATGDCSDPVSFKMDLSSGTSIPGAE
ncbi:hypothetical protein ABBQ32_013567 [Trebouxia sp. C0010 RCD-2024]